MDPEKRSALVGAVLGSAVAAMGAFVVAIAVRYVPIPDSDIHVPRAILGVLGAGFVLCGLSFALSVLGRRVSTTFAVVGIALAFVVPTAWIAFGPGIRECTSSFSLGFLTISSKADAGSFTCRAAFGIATVLAAAIVVAGAGSVVKLWAPSAWGDRLEKAGGGAAALLVGVVLLVALVIASPVLLVKWAARRAYARLNGGSESSEA
jgi:hypothetical protein